MLIGDLLYPPADTRRTTLSLLGWWESRRPTFNLVVGSVGLFTLAFAKLISFLPFGGGIPFDWRPVVAYAVIANICYTFGWGLEAVAQRIWGDRCPRFGPALFRQGIAFSVGLTLLPVLLLSMGWVIQLLKAIL